MANVAYSADIQDLRGKVGTNVFNKARSGSTVRIRTSGKNPRTPGMQGIGCRVSENPTPFPARYECKETLSIFALFGK